MDSTQPGRPPFQVSRASDEITQFPSYESMLSCSPNQHHNSLINNNNNNNNNHHHHHHHHHQSTHNSTPNHLFFRSNNLISFSKSSPSITNPSPSPSASSSASSSNPYHQLNTNILHAVGLPINSPLTPSSLDQQPSAQGSSKAQPPIRHFFSSWFSSKNHQHDHQLGSATRSRHLLLNSSSVELPESVSDDCLDDPQRTLSRLVSLSLSLLGAQLVLTLTILYGIPFLIKLGLTPLSRSTVALALPIAGLLVPPFVGTYSDLDLSNPHRRTNWIASSTLILTFSLFSLAFCQPFGAGLSYLFSSAQGDWDPNRSIYDKANAIRIGIWSLYLITFSSHTLITSSRSLILDQFSAVNQNLANVWSARMLNLGELIILTCVSYSGDVRHGPAQPDLLRLLVGISVPILIICSVITCYYQSEYSGQRLRTPPSDCPAGGGSPSGLLEGLAQQFRLLKTTLVELPVPTRRICYVQMLNSACWYTIYYYGKPIVTRFTLIGLTSNSNVTEAMIRYSERQGTKAMMKLSLVALLAGSIFPIVTSIGSTEYMISRRGPRWNRIRKMLMYITPRNLLSLSFLAYGVLIGFSFAIQTGPGASLWLSSLGVCWAVWEWVPHALLMEYTRSVEEMEIMIEIQAQRDTRDTVVSPGTVNNKTTNERSRLITNSTGLLSSDDEEPWRKCPTKRGGTVFAIFNSSTVIPHVAVSLFAAIMFDLVELINPKPIKQISQPNEILLLIKMIGLMSMIGFIISIKFLVLPTTELEYWDELDYQIYEDLEEVIISEHNNVFGRVNLRVDEEV